MSPLLSSWIMATILYDSLVAVAIVVHMRPPAIPLDMITMRKSIHGFPLLSYTGMEPHLAAL